MEARNPRTAEQRQLANYEEPRKQYNHMTAAKASKLIMYYSDLICVTSMDGILLRLVHFL